LAFEEDGDDNEITYIRAVRDHLGVPIHETAPTRRPLSWFGEKALKEQDFPGFPNAAMFGNMWEAMAADGSCVVLNGQGGDQWLGGSHLYYAEALAQAEWRPLYDSFRADLARFGLRQSLYWFLRHGLFHLLPASFKDMARKLVRPSSSNLHNGAYWLSGEMLQILQQRRSAAARSNKGHPPREEQRALLGCLNDAFSAQIVKEGFDRAGAELGLEVRAPYHRRAYVEWAFATPARMRLRGGINKYMHVQATAKLLPSAVVHRTGKAVFDFVFRPYLDKMRRELVEVIPRERGDLVDAEGMARLYQAYREGSTVGAPMWGLWGVFGYCCLSTSELLREDG
jgi:asparagine synthase (glutamine-hydrolysing)